MFVAIAAAAGTAGTTLSFAHVLLLLGIVVVGMLLAGIVVIVSRKQVPAGAQEQPGSVIRSWLAISLVMGLLVFCAAAFLVDDTSLRSTLFGGLIASTGAAVAFYFSAKSTDQALNAAVTMSQAGIPPTGFTAATPPNPSTGLQYSYQFVANGQPTPRYTLASGDLPDGLILSADGTLEGKATIATGYTFSIRATNAAGSVASPDITINVT